jgi:hypothetical protein
MAQSRGFDETILLNERGEAAECTSANIFAAEGNRVWTPPLSSGCLPGVTRELLLHEIHVPGYTIEEKALAPADLERAAEVFITSTTRTCCPWSKSKAAPCRNPVRPAPPCGRVRRVPGRGPSRALMTVSCPDCGSRLHVTCRCSCAIWWACLPAALRRLRGPLQPGGHSRCPKCARISTSGPNSSIGPARS